MKLIIKNLIFVLKRFKASSILNIPGLPVAFAVFFVITVQTHYGFGFDRNNVFEIKSENGIYPCVIRLGDGKIKNYSFQSPGNPAFDTLREILKKEKE